MYALGNIYAKEHQPSNINFATPTIKQDVYTTGRGGSGNMVYNDPQHPEIARESQDVETPPLRVEEAPHHTGRGTSLLHRGFYQGVYQGIVISEREYDDDTDMGVRSTGGAANAYVPSADEEKLVRQAEEEQLRRVYSRKEHEAAGESEEKK